jgi:GAF domain
VACGARPGPCWDALPSRDRTTGCPTVRQVSNAITLARLPCASRFLAPLRGAEVDREALLGILDGLAHDRESGSGSGDRLVNACVDVVDVTGAGIMLMVGDEHRGTLGASDEAIGIVEELQFTLGEGPCVDAFHSGQPVSEPRLADPDVARWPQFSGPAVDAGVAAIFGFPLQVGSTRIGALDLYSDRVGGLRPEQVTDALIMADVITHAVLELQAAAEPGGLAPELYQRTALRTVVHQAAGMLSVQLDLPVDDALSRLRAYAYAESQSIDAVGRAIVDRRLVFEP